MKDKKSALFLQGFRDGLPIGLGYFAVAFSLGIMAKLAGLTPFQGALASFLTNASAGEYAGFMVIMEKSGYIEMVVMTIVASARYFLMACALAQRFPADLHYGHRLLLGFDLTDEIFALSILRPGYVEPFYTYGTYILPLLGWSSGTFLGIFTGNLLPAAIVNALSVALYGMFIAIIIPPSRENKVILLAVLVSFGLSFLLSRLPLTAALSGGTRTILLTLVIAGAWAALFPVKEAKHG